MTDVPSCAQEPRACLKETAWLQLVLVAMFLAEVLSGDEPRTRAVDGVLGFSSSAISGGEVWRLVTPALLHTSPGIFDTIGVQHLVLNSVVLWIVGPALRLLVTSRMWWTTAVTGAAGGFSAVWVVGSDGTGFGGSSAITWALMTGACTAWTLSGLRRRGEDAAASAGALGRRRYVLLACTAWLVLAQPFQIVAQGVREPQMVHAGAAVAGGAVALVAATWSRLSRPSWGYAVSDAEAASSCSGVDRQGQPAVQHHRQDEIREGT